MYWLSLDDILEVLSTQLINELRSHYRGSVTSFSDIRQYLVSGSGRLGVGNKSRLVKPLQSVESCIDAYLATMYAAQKKIDRDLEAARMLTGILVRKPPQFTDDILRSKGIEVNHGFIALDVILRVVYVSLTGQQPDKPEKLAELRNYALSDQRARARRRHEPVVFGVSRLGDVLAHFAYSVLAGKPLNERLEAAQEMGLGVHIPKPNFIPRTASSHIWF
jgi:hypothetical protein